MQKFISVFTIHKVLIFFSLLNICLYWIIVWCSNEYSIRLLNRVSHLFAFILNEEDKFSFSFSTINNKIKEVRNCYFKCTFQDKTLNYFREKQRHNYYCHGQKWLYLKITQDRIQLFVSLYSLYLFVKKIHMYKYYLSVRYFKCLRNINDW